jgi:hypothetical protein
MIAYPNTQFEADYVVTQATGSDWFWVWHNNTVICTDANRLLVDLIATGASARKQSVYNATTGEFLCGTLDQMT